MTDLEYVGPVIDQNTDVSYRAYVTSRMSENLTATQIDATITGVLNSYATKQYVDQRDALNATPDYVQQQDNLRVKQVYKEINGGVAGLDANGKLTYSRIQNNSTQRWPKGFWSPNSYFASPVILGTSTETQIYTTSITDPGYPYRIMIFGEVDGLSANDGLHPVVNVRVGGTSGTIIAQGRGISDSYNYWSMDTFDRTTSGNAGGSSFYNEFVTHGSAGTVSCNGSSLVYNKRGSDGRGLLLKRSGEDATLADDYLEITCFISRSCEQADSVTLDNAAHNKIYGRMSSDRTSYVCFDIRGDTNLGASSTASLIFCNGSETRVQESSANEFIAGHTYVARFGTSSGKRWFQLLNNGNSIINYNDTSAQSPMGSSNRGWGLGFVAGRNFSFGFPVSQAAPGGLNAVAVNDLTPGVDGSSYGTIKLQPINLHVQPVNTGPKSLVVTLNRSVASGTVGVYPSMPKLYALAIPA